MTGLTLLRALVFVICVGATFAATRPSAAQDPEPVFERLPDGRLLVEIFGQKIALPATEVDLDRIRFYPSKEPLLGRTTFTLRQALAEPEKARRTFEREPNWVSIHIVMDWPAENKPILGRFPPGSVPRSSAASPLTIGIDRVPPRGELPRGKLPEHWSPESTIPDEDGYFVRPGVTPPRTIRPTDTGYRLPAAQRLWPTEVDLVIVCSWTGAPVRKCRQTHKTRDGRISVTWSWFEVEFPKSRWRELDLRLHDVAEYLLVNKPEGELE